MSSAERKSASASDESSISEGVHILRIEPDRLAIIGDRQIVFTLVLPCEAAIVVGECIFRIEADGFAIIGDRSVEIALFVKRDAAIVVDICVIGSKPKSSVVFHKGGGRVA